MTSKTFGILLVGAFMFVAGCAIAAPVVPTYTYRYKLTVEVQTPDGIRTGSAVREVTTKDTTLIFGPGPNSSVDYRGEAVVVDMGELGPIFVLGRRAGDVDYAYRIVWDMFPYGRGSRVPEGMRYYDNLEGKRDVPLSQVPDIVWFRDRNEPTSVELVFESKDEDNTKDSPSYVSVNRFEDIFGKGVKLKRVTIEMTDEAVTKHKVIGWLSWLPAYYNKLLDDREIHTIRAENQLANSLGAGSFSSEERKHGQ